MIKKSKNLDLTYLELLYEITNLALDRAQLWQDWDRQNRHRHERDVRAEMKRLNKEEVKIRAPNSI